MCQCNNTKNKNMSQTAEGITSIILPRENPGGVYFPENRIPPVGWPPPGLIRAENTKEDRDAKTKRLVMYFQIAAASAAIIYYFITVATRKGG